MKIIMKKEPCLYKESNLTDLLEISPFDPEGWEKSCSKIKKKTYRRDLLAETLLSYNKMLGNDLAALQNIEKLKDTSKYCVFTGQQLGLLGGPMFSILKAITCLLIAREYDAIPIFWMATEDHDVDEIDHTYFLDSMGNIKKYHLPLPKEGLMIEDLQLNSDHQEILCSLFRSAGLEELIPEIIVTPSYAKLMTRVLLLLFKGTGLVFIEPKILRPLAKEFFKKEIKNAAEISKVLQQSSEKISQSGSVAILNLKQGTNLFYKYQGKYRCKIKTDKDGFKIGTKHYAKEELLDLIESNPELFSTNVAARPVLQSLLFPTAAYVAGPGEMNYYHELKAYHHFHGVSMPWIVPRISATLIPKKAQDILRRCHLEPFDPLPETWSQAIPGVNKGIEELNNTWFLSAQKIFSENLSSESLKRLVDFATGKIEKKVVASRLRKQGVSPDSLHYLRNLLYPRNRPQERVYCWSEFQSLSDEKLVMQFLNKGDWKFRGHHFCYL